jgi:UDP-glucose 4-epimerase
MSGDGEIYLARCILDIRGKKVVVIGGAGLIGSHTIDQLLLEDVRELVVYDNFTRGCRENLADALRDPRVRIFEAGGDILQLDMLEAALQGADGVFHFAALWLAQCRDFPRSAFEVNVRGTFNVIDACVTQRVARLVFSSSASVYGDAVKVPMTEDHPFNNRNFYGATKICGESLLRAMYYRYGLGYIGLRYMNVYGPRQDYRGAYAGVIMAMLDALERGEGPTIHGDGSEAFDFTDVEDCARANVLGMKSDRVDRFYNVGTGVCTSLRELAQLLMTLTGHEREIGFVAQPDVSLVRSRIGSALRAKEELGFIAQVPLAAGLQRTIDWRRQSERALRP